MATQALLRRGTRSWNPLSPGKLRLAAAGLLWIGSAVRPEAARAHQALLQPERLTAGSSDQLMGEASPDGQWLIYASNEFATWRLFLRQVRQGIPEPLFPQEADAIDPHFSPDGESIAYISYRLDATGDVCVLSLKTRHERCLTDARTAESQVAWTPEGASLLVLVRSGLHEDLVLERIRISDGRRTPVLRRNIGHFSPTPDGRGIVYVPMERRVADVGISFARSARGILEVARLDPDGKAPLQSDSDPELASLRITFDLPGVSAYPQLSPDGAYLYFSQYLNDTNFDGRIDGDDHSVIFRIPIDDETYLPLPGSIPEQLTSARLNCQYPSPGKHELLVTCAFQGSLDVYALPLTGTLPESWDLTHLEDALSAPHDVWERLLILGRLAALRTHDSERIHDLKAILRLHLGLREYESSSFFAEQLLGRARAVDPKLERFSLLLRELIASRREELRLSEGQLSQAFVRDALARLSRLKALEAGETDPDLRIFSLLCQLEVYDVLGEKGSALRILRSIDPSQVKDGFVAHLLVETGSQFLDRMQESDQALALLNSLSAHPAFSGPERVRLAEKTLELLLRGVPRTRQDAVLAEQLESLDPTGELAFVLRVAQALQSLEEDDEESVRARLFTLFQTNEALERRRALVAAVARMAARTNSDYLLYQFANTWVSSLPREKVERYAAELLYRDVVLERAYMQSRSGRISDARGNFFGVTLQMLSLESHIGFIEARLLEGQDDLDAQYARIFRKNPDSAEARFVRAYRLTRDLPHPDERGSRDPSSTEAALDEILALLQECAVELPRSLELHALWGYVTFRRFELTRSFRWAQESIQHYLLALDLARQNPRYSAPILQALALAYSSIENYRMALDTLAQRRQYPVLTAPQRLSLDLLQARCLYHLERESEAAELSDKMSEFIQEDASLSRFQSMILERASLYHFAAGHSRSLQVTARQMHFQAALDRADALVSLLESAGSRRDGAATSHEDLPLSRYHALLLRAASAQAINLHERALADLDVLSRMLDHEKDLWNADLEANPPTDRYYFGKQAHALLLLGLSGESLRATGQLEAAEHAWLKREQGLVARLKREDLDEDLAELIELRRMRAEVAVRLGRLEDARRLLELGARDAVLYQRRTQTDLTPEGLRLIRAQAELLLFHQTGSPGQVKAILEQTWRQLSARRNPEWDEDQFLLGLYLVWLDL